MQNLKLTQKEDRYSIKLLFLHELINVFTRSLNIKNRSFYSKINKNLKHVPILSSLSYNEQGLLSFEAVFEDYKKSKESENALYQTIPYFSSLSRLLALIYSEASIILREEKSKNILKKSFKIAKKKYTEIPDLEGYIPRETRGLSSSSSSSSSAFSVTLMDNMIKYLVDEVIKKSMKPELIAKVKEIRPSKEQNVKQVKKVYTEMLGPQGIKSFEKIRNNLTVYVVKEDIDTFVNVGLITEEDAKNFKNKIDQIFRRKIEEPISRFFGE